MTGECPQHSREEIECEISKHGGRATTAVRSKTTHLVVGEYDVQKYGEHYISGKHKKCIELNSKGAHIEIIDYNKLYDMMGMTV